MRDVRPGLWIWSVEHPEWEAGQGWAPRVWSTCAEVDGEVTLIDPIAPPEGDPVWERLDARPPTQVVIAKPDHVRNVDAIVERYGCRAFGPALFWPDGVPRTRLEPIEPGSRLRGGIEALYDGRGRNETPLWLSLQKAIVFADALTAPEGELRVWNTPWHEERALPALRAMLDLPFEVVVVSHGEPVHDRAAFEAALRRPPHDE